MPPYCNLQPGDTQSLSDYVSDDLKLLIIAVQEIQAQLKAMQEERNDLKKNLSVAKEKIAKYENLYGKLPTDQEK